MISQSYTPVKFERECPVVLIPDGMEAEIPAGTVGYITQSMGGNFTVYVEGRLFRVAGDDADAIGKEPPPRPHLPEDASDGDLEALIWRQMKTCYDPEIPINVVDLGLIYDCQVEPVGDGQRDVHVQMTLTAPGCGMGEFLVDDVKNRIELIPTVRKARVSLTFDPPWNQHMMSEAARLETGMF